MAFPSAFAVWTDELNALVGETIAQRTGVRCTVVNQSRRMLVQDMIVKQRFDQSHFGGAGAVQIDGQWQTASTT